MERYLLVLLVFDGLEKLQRGLDNLLVNRHPEVSSCRPDTTGAGASSPPLIRPVLRGNEQKNV
eukprot:scaffold435303_cov42-Prasinocladus_malaysianus.AAC.1